MKTSHTLLEDIEKIRCKLPPCLLAFIVSEDTAQTTGGEKAPAVSPSCEPIRLDMFSCAH